MELQAGQKVMQCPFEGCGAEIVYTLKAEDLNRGVAVVKCSHCLGNVFVEIRVVDGQVEMTGPMVLRLG